MNEWQPFKHYARGHIVNYNGKEYEANCNIHSTVTPDISSNWELLQKEETMKSKAYTRLKDWISNNSADPEYRPKGFIGNYGWRVAISDLDVLENLTHPPEKPSPEIDTTTSMPVMHCDDSFRISRPEAVKSLMEILDVTTGDKVKILESLVLMYTKDEE